MRAMNASAARTRARMVHFSGEEHNSDDEEYGDGQQYKKYLEANGHQSCEAAQASAVVLLRACRGIVIAQHLRLDVLGVYLHTLHAKAFFGGFCLGSTEPDYQIDGNDGDGKAKESQHHEKQTPDDGITVAEVMC